MFNSTMVARVELFGSGPGLVFFRPRFVDGHGAVPEWGIYNHHIAALQARGDVFVAASSYVKLLNPSALWLLAFLDHGRSQLDEESRIDTSLIAETWSHFLRN
jgi:hypothetical protein